jgi:bifunctional non-homologous end joining protein LigD
MSSRKQELVVDDRSVAISNPDKELYTDEHLTKSDVIEHYRRVADVMLPHLHGRPLSLRRFPDGIGGDGFFQKEASDFFPDWLEVVEVPRREGGRAMHQVVCRDEADLVYLANLATLEFHIWPSTVAALDRPDRLVIDIDPPDGTPVRELRDVARRLRDLIGRIGLTAYVQATGGRGFHVVAPLDASAGYDDVRDLARGIADQVAADDPDRLTTAIRKESRGDRIFLDVNRNGYGQTFIAPYSLRSRPGAPVATPLEWSELGKAEPSGFDPSRIRRRLAQRADPWRRIDEYAGASATAIDELGKLRGRSD